MQKLDDVSESLLQNTIENIPADTVLQVVDQFINGTPEEDTLRNLKHIAADHGLEPEQFKAAVQHVRGALITQGHTALVEAGIPPEQTQAVFNWAMNHYGKEWAIEQQKGHWQRGDVGYCRKIAAAYLTRYPLCGAKR